VNSTWTDSIGISTAKSLRQESVSDVARSENLSHAHYQSEGEIEISRASTRRTFNLLTVRSIERALTLCDRQQRWIELNERGVERRFGGVAAIASGGHRSHLGSRRLPLEAEESPFPWKTVEIFYMHGKPQDRALGVSFVIRIGGRHVLRPALFDNEHGLIGPCSRLQKCFVRLRVDENSIENAVSARLHLRRVSGSVKVRGEINPLAIVLGELELAIRSKFRTCAGWDICAFRGRCGKERE
jgi:hypothetical protein